MNLVEITPPPYRPAAEIIAEELLAGMNAKLALRIQDHISGFRAFWDSPETPDAICNALGTNGKIFIESSKESLRHIAALAAMAGKTLDDAISQDFYAPRRGIVIAENGTITLAPPADGFDAWGRAIPAPEPEPEPEPDQP